jgi:hypothetical protein
MFSRQITKSRWERKRALLPKLRLAYPTEEDVLQLAGLAKIETDRQAHFGSPIRNIILDAHLNNDLYRDLSAVEVRRHLLSVRKKALDLKKALAAVDVGTKGSAESAGNLLEIGLTNSKLKELPDYQNALLELAKAADAKIQVIVSKRGPKGAGGNMAFDFFIQGLHMAALMFGGKWTISRSVDGSWKGTYLEALKILTPYLPRGLLPIADIGRSIEHVRKRLTDHITKNL